MDTKPNWTPIVIRLGDIIPWEHNPRMSNKAQAQRLIESERKFGQPLPFQVSPQQPDGRYKLYDGHQRYGAWLTVYGENHKVAASMCDRELSEDERLEYVITMHAGATGQWDWQKMASFPAPKLIELGFDNAKLKEWNNDANNLKEMLQSEKPVQDAEPQIDRAAELLEKWQVKPGDLWQIGAHRLLCGDSTKREDVERVMGGEKADCIMTDPPYGMNLNTDYSDMPETRIASKTYDKVEGDDKDFNAAPFIAMFDYVKEQFYWGGDYFYTTLPIGGSWIVWDKRNENSDGLVGNHFEVCWSRTPHRRRMIRVHWSGVNARNQGIKREHPTEKSIKVLIEILNDYTSDNAIIIDFFCGSGTTLVACQNLSRRGRAIEISPAYCAVTLERMATAFPGIEIKRLD
jgi:DNA modification methylase